LYGKILLTALPPKRGASEAAKATQGRACFEGRCGSAFLASCGRASPVLQKSSQASKTFFQLLQIERLQLKLTHNLQNSYQVSSQHQVPKTWVQQHPKTQKPKTKRKFISERFQAQTVPFGSNFFPSIEVVYQAGKTIAFCKFTELMQWEHQS
jgi:hypothetical protein